jgi:hypothetical protein
MSKHGAHQVGPGSSTQMSLNSLLMAAPSAHGRPLAYRALPLAFHERSSSSSHTRTTTAQSVEERRQTVVHLMNAALDIAEDFEGSTMQGGILPTFGSNSSRSNSRDSSSFSQ